MPIRFSIIDYLNALPLNMAFKEGLFDDEASLSFDYPSQCADNLATGRADVGLISSIEYQRIPQLVVAPGVAIAAKREVRSVLILTRKDLADVDVIALDRFSRSSVALLRILLHRRYGKRPRFVTMTPDAPRMLAEADAALIIGDAALELHADADVQVIDLAREWQNETGGLPAVFAFWAMRTDTDQARVAAMVQEAKAYGLAHIDQRMAQIQQRWHLPPDTIHRYLHQHIYYDLGTREITSLELFYRYAFESGQLSQVRPLTFAPTAHRFP